MVPKNIWEAYEIDSVMETSQRTEAVDKEINQLIDRDCFEFK